MGLQRVVVAGASGFVGRALVEALRTQHEVIALTRSKSLPPADPPGRPGVQWRTADLFSLLDVEHALEGADAGYYLVHSMLPSAELTQGGFQDFDLILADNFARGARKRGLSQLIYLGGLIPEDTKLSPHLRSRFEVEQTFRAHGVPFTAVRASIVIGPRGSSFRIVESLVRRLPVMIAPKWTQTPTQPVALDDVVTVLSRALGNPALFDRVCEVGGPDVVSYRELMARTARLMGLKRRFYPVPAFSPGLSTLWVSLVTGTPRELVAPLVQSLKHPMVVHDDGPQKSLGVPGRPLDEAIRAALQHAPDGHSHRRHPAPRTPTRKDVRSVQRLPLPPGWSAQDVAREYVRFLPRFCRPFLRVETNASGDSRFYAWPVRRCLLELTYSAERSTPDRQLFYITGGRLARVGSGLARGRLELREVLGKRFVLAGIHAFSPTLPWRVYNVTQALVHLWVMRGFGRHLAKLSKEGARPAEAPALSGSGTEEALPPPVHGERAVTAPAPPAL